MICDQGGDPGGDGTSEVMRKGREKGRPSYLLSHTAGTGRHEEAAGRILEEEVEECSEQDTGLLFRRCGLWLLGEELSWRWRWMSPLLRMYYDYVLPLERDGGLGS